MCVRMCVIFPDTEICIKPAITINFTFFLNKSYEHSDQKTRRQKQHYHALKVRKESKDEISILYSDIIDKYLHRIEIQYFIIFSF